MRTNNITLTLMLGLPFVTLLVSTPMLSQESQKKPPQTKSTGSKPTSVPAPTTLTQEEAFYYFLAVYGSPPDVVDRYGRFFDAAGYKRAMADEFSRHQYREEIRSHIESSVRRIDFNKRFIAVGEGKLGEYSFERRAFPFAGVPRFGYCLNSDHSSGICYGSLMDVDIFSPDIAINSPQIRWTLPMSPDAAASFVRRRQTASGSVDRSVTFRITYSIVEKGAAVGDDFRDATFYPLVHAVDVFADETFSEKLGSLAVTPSRYATAGEWGAAIRRAQKPSREIGSYSYIAYMAGSRGSHAKPVYGTITLTDVGFSMSGEQEWKEAQPRDLSFYDALVRSRSNEQRKECRIVRVNYAFGDRTYRVVFSPLARYDYESPLVFEGGEERDRFFTDLTAAIRIWHGEYAELVTATLDIDDRCMANSRNFPCSTSTPNETASDNPMSPATGGSPTEKASSPSVPGNRREGSSSGSVSALAPASAGRSLNELQAAIAAGEDVAFTVKGLHSGVAYFADGTLTISKATVKLRLVLGAWSAGFEVASSKVVEVKHQPPRLHIRVIRSGLDRNMKTREYTDDFYVWHPNSLVKGNISGRGTGNVACEACDDTIEKLQLLLDSVRSGPSP